jgi:hypothetical protein
MLGGHLSRPLRSTRLRRAGAFIVVGCAFAAAPAIAGAAPVNLGTASPFAVLGGQTVTNTGPSVLNGDLGVWPGNALVGFNSATVNGATHNNDAVAAQAQLDLTTAYNVAAGSPFTADYTGAPELGNRQLTAGVYHFDAAALLTGTLTLDGQNNPDAQFVFQIGSALTTQSASVVALINGASPCNVFWQVGSDATLGSTTAFQGNLMALSSISLVNGATVQGRLLARNAAVTLDNNVINRPACTTPATPDGGGSGGGGGGTGTGTGTGGTPVIAPPGSETTVPTRNGTITWKRETPRGSGGQPACTDGFTATLRGRQIKKVVYRLDGRVVKGAAKSPFRLFVRGLPGKHKVTARVTFKDATPTKTLSLNYRACAAVALRPTQGPSRFTG